MIQTIKAITLWQPWASLVACGAKQYETRSWPTRYRGPIAIHAATKPVIKLLRMLDQNTIDAMGMALTSSKTGGYGANDLLDLPIGEIVATGELVECWKMVSLTTISDNSFEAGIYAADERRSIKGDELLFGDWTPGRYAWEIANVQMLETPIPAMGRQGLWNWEYVLESSTKPEVGENGEV